MSNAVDGNESEDDSLDPSTASSPTDLTKDGSDQVTARSTSEPLRKPSTSRRKQAEERYQLIKNLSQSIANRHKIKKVEKKNDTVYEAFGNYVAQALSELDSQVSHMAQNEISNIIFQAQAGLLTQEIQAQTMMQPRINLFHPIMQPGMSSSPQPQMYGQNSAAYRDDCY